MNKFLKTSSWSVWKHCRSNLTSFNKFSPKYVTPIQMRNCSNQIIPNEKRLHVYKEGTNNLAEEQVEGLLKISENIEPHPSAWTFTKRRKSEPHKEMGIMPFARPTTLDARLFLDELKSAKVGPSFNLAAFANHHKTIQEFIKLGVDLAFIEKQKWGHDVCQMILMLDFDQHIKPHIRFLVDHGLPPDKLGEFFTLNMNFLKVNLEDAQVRINYLESKRFTNRAIAKIITEEPKFLNFAVKIIDAKLGMFQKEYCLSGSQVRSIITNCPGLVRMKSMVFRETSFMVKQEMGFELNEIHTLLENAPEIWFLVADKKFTILSRERVVETFDYVHNTMGVSHELIAKFGPVLTTRTQKIQDRNLYLKALSKDQYDPTQPLYVPLSAFYESTSDNEFCEKYAKTCVDDFNVFLKTL